MVKEQDSLENQRNFWHGEMEKLKDGHSAISERVTALEVTTGNVKDDMRKVFKKLDSIHDDVLVMKTGARIWATITGFVSATIVSAFLSWYKD